MHTFEISIIKFWGCLLIGVRDSGTAEVLTAIMLVLTIVGIKIYKSKVTSSSIHQIINFIKIHPLIEGLLGLW
jgi:hypothetical protein